MSAAAAQGQSKARLTVKILKAIRTDEAFDLFFGKVELSRQETGTNPAVLPRKRSAPQRFEIGSEDGHHSRTVEDHFRPQFFEVLVIVINSIERRFEQRGYGMYQNLESLLVVGCHWSKVREY